MSTKKFIVELEQGEILPLERAEGVRLTSLLGTLWVTEQHTAADVVLQTGQSHAVETRGRTLVQAMERARLAVESPAAQPRLAFGVFSASRTAA